MNKRITTYEYGFGTLEQLRTKELEQIHHLKRLEDLNSVPHRTPFIGIYQIETYKESPEEIAKRRYVEKEFASLQVLWIQDVFKVLEGCHQHLIHVAIYEQVPFEAIHGGLHDETKRIRISQIGNLPNFFEKDTDKFYELVHKTNESLGPEEKPPAHKIKEVFRSLEPQYLALNEHYSKFGFTRSEWAQIYLNYSKFFLERLN